MISITLVTLVLVGAGHASSDMDSALSFSCSSFSDRPSAGVANIVEMYQPDQTALVLNQYEAASISSSVSRGLYTDNDTSDATSTEHQRNITVMLQWLGTQECGENEQVSVNRSESRYSASRQDGSTSNNRQGAGVFQQFGRLQVIGPTVVSDTDRVKQLELDVMLDMPDDVQPDCDRLMATLLCPRRNRGMFANGEWIHEVRDVIVQMTPDQKVLVVDRIKTHLPTLLNAYGIGFTCILLSAYLSLTHSYQHTRLNASQRRFSAIISALD